VFEILDRSTSNFILFLQKEYAGKAKA